MLAFRLCAFGSLNIFRAFIQKKKNKQKNEPIKERGKTGNTSMSLVAYCMSVCLCIFEIGWYTAINSFNPGPSEDRRIKPIDVRILVNCVFFSFYSVMYAFNVRPTMIMQARFFLLTCTKVCYTYAYIKLDLFILALLRFIPSLFPHLFLTYTQFTVYKKILMNNEYTTTSHWLQIKWL